jgi:hypothetical protein
MRTRSRKSQENPRKSKNPIKVQINFNKKFKKLDIPEK